MHDLAWHVLQSLSQPGTVASNSNHLSRFASGLPDEHALTFEFVRKSTSCTAISDDRIHGTAPFHDTFHPALGAGTIPIVPGPAIGTKESHSLPSCMV